MDQVHKQAEFKLDYAYNRQPTSGSCFSADVTWSRMWFLLVLCSNHSSITQHWHGTDRQTDMRMDRIFAYPVMSPLWWTVHNDSTSCGCIKNRINRACQYCAFSTRATRKKDVKIHECGPTQVESAMIKINKRLLLKQINQRRSLHRDQALNEPNLQLPRVPNPQPKGKNGQPNRTVDLFLSARGTYIYYVKCIVIRWNNKLQPLM